MDRRFAQVEFGPHKVDVIEGGYYDRFRMNPDEAPLVLHLVATAQQAGFRLDEVGTLLPPDPMQWQHGKLLETVRLKVRDIEALEARLKQSKAHLVSLIAEIEAKPAEVDCTTTAKRVLSRMRRGEVPGLALASNDVKALGKAKRSGRSGPARPAPRWAPARPFSELTVHHRNIPRLTLNLTSSLSFVQWRVRVRQPPRLAVKPCHRFDNIIIGCRH
jgi:hypothetical protein